MTDTHTPDKSTLPCGCKIDWEWLVIDYCPVHVQAPRMLEFIEQVAGGDCHTYTKHLDQAPCGTCETCQARAILRDIGGKNG